MDLNLDLQLSPVPGPSSFYHGPRPPQPVLYNPMANEVPPEFQHLYQQQHPPSQQPTAASFSTLDQDQAHHATLPPRMRKRKAETQDNERLSKRLSLLNLGMKSLPPSLARCDYYSHEHDAHHQQHTEQNGQKLYVPVESPQLRPLAEQQQQQQQTLNQASSSPDNEQMQLDNSKHKVYIYDLDTELSSDGEDSASGYSSSDEGKLVYLSDIGKHLRDARQQQRPLPLAVPRPILPNQDGELAGMQVVLYQEPKSLSVPESQDSVRKAIAEARARLRRRQAGAEDDDAGADAPAPPRRVPNGLDNLANDPVVPRAAPGVVPMDDANDWPIQVDNDPDAMEMDID
jgi:hypothetical protein